MHINTLKANIRHIKLSSNHTNLHISTGKSMTLLPTCNWRRKAEEASSGRAQHFCRAGSLLHCPFQFKPWFPTKHTSPNLRGELPLPAPPQKKINGRGYFLCSDQNTCFQKFKQLLFLKKNHTLLLLNRLFQEQCNQSKKVDMRGRGVCFLFSFSTIKDGCGLLCRSHQIPNDLLLEGALRR